VTYTYEIHTWAESFRGGSVLDREWYQITSDIPPNEINARIGEIVPGLGKQCGFECDQEFGECSCGYECAHAACLNPGIEIN
jgi:hypothetical protein